jgi:hypothetical protein
MLKKKGKTGNVFLPARSRCFFMTIPFGAGMKQKSQDVTVQQRRFAAAADARKRPAKCSGAREPSR